MTSDAPKAFNRLGQSLWLDNITRAERLAGLEQRELDARRAAIDRQDVYVSRFHGCRFRTPAISRNRQVTAGACFIGFFPSVGSLPPQRAFMIPSFGLGLCQPPRPATIASASFGPQLRRC